MRKSLTLKMFIIIFLSILSLFGLIAGFQYFYYLNFYESKKIEETAHNLNEYIHKYSDGNWTLEEQLIQAKNFNIENNASLYVTQVSNLHLLTPAVPVFENKIVVSAVDANQVYFDFYLEEEDFDTIFELKSLEENPNIIVSGLVDSYQTLYPTSINSVVIDNETLPGQTENFSGTLSVVDVYDLSNQSNLFSVNPSLIYEAYDTEIKNGTINNINYTISQVSNTNVKQVDFFYSKENEAYDELFLVNLSLLSVSESMRIYQDFLPLLIATTVVIALIVSIIYSKQVSKPIVEITQVANEMSRLNFDKQLPDQRQDELGVLSRSINTLSSSLNKSLQDLSQANIRLQEDYDNEVKQELIRKNFVANVSHEIKTPLGVIKSYAEGIKDLVKKEKQDYYIDVIIDEIDRMDILLVELLELSKLDSGHTVYQTSALDIKAYLDKLITHHDYLLDQSNLSIELKGSFFTIKADQEKMYRVFNNLLSNAIKYAIRDTTIVITGNSDKRPSISIFNKCQPISRDQNEQIWHRFYKVDESHNREIEGNGLGLSIVKSIVEGHGFTCYSKLHDGGISFTIEF